MAWIKQFYLGTYYNLGAMRSLVWSYWLIKSPARNVIIVLLWSAGMGRKLRFFVTKNRERKKALAVLTLTLPVCIPLSSIQLDVEKPLELVHVLHVTCNS